MSNSAGTARLNHTTYRSHAIALARPSHFARRRRPFRSPPYLPNFNVDEETDVSEGAEENFDNDEDMEVAEGSGQVSDDNTDM